MKRNRSILSFLAAALFAYQVHAGIGNDIPSCYSANKIKIAAPPSKMEVFILIDQTTPLDTTLQGSVRENTDRLIQPGASFVVAGFSSFGQGRYLEILSAGALEAPIDATARDDISVKVLRGFDACMSGQFGFGRKSAAVAINKAMAAASPDLAKSDIWGSLKELSSRVKQSEAKDKVIFLVSDMLENSGVSSFYANKNIRAFDPATELKKAQDAQLVGDFGGARVFVLGAGLVQENAGGKNKDSGVYRNPKTMALLRQFWDSYFTAAHATLIEFGAPALLSPVK